MVSHGSKILLAVLIYSCVIWMAMAESNSTECCPSPSLSASDNSTEPSGHPVTPSTNSTRSDATNNSSSRCARKIVMEAISVCGTSCQNDKQLFDSCLSKSKVSDEEIKKICCPVDA
ncbi:hypothetical protein CRE_30137 [Caenorhabditis remanei]|uniref:Uncharacterized protein n=1 Tax=Caenorhabditis remanei TaxID=31234 RepID=E3NAJ5_CAERE|nr:hypothetical protein CRE_30137 [Caenorhabditis remanei]